MIQKMSRRFQCCLNATTAKAQDALALGWWWVMERMGRWMAEDLKAKFWPLEQCNCLNQVQLTQYSHQPESGSTCMSVCHVLDQRSSTKLQNQPCQLKKASKA